MRRAVSLLSLLILLLAACSQGGSDAAAVTVNGTEITRDELFEELELLETDQLYAQFRGLTATRTDANTYDSRVVADLLNQLVARELALSLLEKEGIEVTDDHRQEASERLGIEGDDSTEQRILDWVAPLVALNDLVPTEEPTEADLQAIFEGAGEGAFDEACASHILFMTETRSEEEAIALAEEALERIESGEDFKSVATEVSEDPGSGPTGGSLGCGPRGSYVEPFEEAVWNQPVGEVGDVVVTEFGAHLVLVESRLIPEQWQEAESKLREQFTAQQEAEASQELQRLLDAESLRAEVSVNPKYGRWAYVLDDASGGGEVEDPAEATRGAVLPPAGATPTSTVPLVPLPTGP